MSDNIEKTELSDNFIIYRTSCECGADDHQIEMHLTYNKEFLESELYFKTWYYPFDSMLIEKPKWLSSKFEWLIKIVNFLILTKFYLYSLYKLIKDRGLETNASFIFKNEKHLNDFAQALIEGSSKLHFNNSKIKRLEEKIKELEGLQEKI